MTVADIISQTQHKMGRTIQTLREDFVKIRTGRASTGLLEHVMVDYYGCPTPINQVAQIGVGDARTLTVQPWETGMLAAVEKAIRNSEGGNQNGNQPQPDVPGDGDAAPAAPLS